MKQTGCFRTIHVCAIETFFWGVNGEVSKVLRRAKTQIMWQDCVCIVATAFYVDEKKLFSSFSFLACRKKYKDWLREEDRNKDQENGKWTALYYLKAHDNLTLIHSQSRTSGLPDESDLSSRVSPKEELPLHRNFARYYDSELHNILHHLDKPRW